MFGMNKYARLRADIVALNSRITQHHAAHTKQSCETVLKFREHSEELAGKTLKLKSLDERLEKLFAWAVKAGERIDALEACKCRCGEELDRDVSDMLLPTEDPKWFAEPKRAKKPAKKAAKKRK